MWSRIQVVLSYCEMEHRMLVLDTTKNWFRDDWRSYFSITSPWLYTGDTPELITSLLQRDVVPSALHGVSYQDIPHATWLAPGHMEMNGIRVSIPLVPYSESVVVYADCGSIPHILNLFSILRFSSEVCEELKQRRSVLPTPYLAVHIRHTDYKSNLVEFFHRHHTTLSSVPFFLASDHLDTISYCTRTFPVVYTFSYIPSLPEGCNIHESSPSQQLRTTPEEIKRWNKDAILDFLLLAMGNQILCSSHQSGFSRSAALLQQYHSILFQCI